MRRHALAITMAALCTSTAIADHINVYSHFVREGTVGGLGGVLENNAFYSWNYEASNVVPTSITRPTGSSTWDSTWDAGPILGFSQFAQGPAASQGGAPFADVATAAAWADSNVKGVWGVDHNGSNWTFDTTSGGQPGFEDGYVNVLDRDYYELTAASAQQFLDIRAQGLTGNFTFDLTSAAADLNNVRFSLNSENTGFFAGDRISMGSSSFTVNITTALAADATLELSFGTSALWYNPAPGIFSVGLGMQSRTLYGYSYSITAVPGVGGIAAVAGLGLAGRRRR